MPQSRFSNGQRSKSRSAWTQSWGAWTNSEFYISKKHSEDVCVRTNERELEFSDIDRCLSCALVFAMSSGRQPSGKSIPYPSQTGPVPLHSPHLVRRPTVVRSSAFYEAQLILQVLTLLLALVFKRILWLLTVISVRTHSVALKHEKQPDAVFRKRGTASAIPNWGLIVYFPFCFPPVNPVRMRSAHQ